MILRRNGKCSNMTDMWQKVSLLRYYCCHLLNEKKDLTYLWVEKKDMKRLRLEEWECLPWKGKEGSLLF